MVTGNRLTAARGKGVGDNGGKKGKGLVKEHVGMTHGHGQQGGDGLWEQRMGQDGGGQRKENWDNCNKLNKNKLKLIQI